MTTAVGVGSTLVSGLIVGSLAIVSGAASAFNSGQTAVADDRDPVMEYSVNATGQTYGSDMNATSYDQIPDLIAAVGVGGKSGYIRRADVYQRFSSPQEALASQSAYGKKSRTINVYAVDGKTVVDSFTIASSEGFEPSPSQLGVGR